MAEAIRPKFDLTGSTFGRLTVLEFAFRKHRPTATNLHWRCACECGNESIVVANRLRSGHTKSCGKCEKPGGLRTEWPGYSSWKAAAMRCGNRNHRAFADYGGRGISMCDRWRFGQDGKTGFECFFQDMGPRPDGLTLDRINIDGNYEPGNCRWANRSTQQQNQRRAIYVEIGGVKVPLKKYVRRLGLCYESVRFKVRKKGLTPLAAVRHFVRARAA